MFRKPDLKNIFGGEIQYFRTIKGWDDLVPATDLAVIHDLTSHQHPYIGDPSPCNDNALYVGEPMVGGAKCGQTSLEYEGIFRVVEHTGRQASVIDPVHSTAKLGAAPLVILPGSPFIHSTTAQALENYVHDGGKLVVSGTWPSRNDSGTVITFLGGAPAKPGEPVAKGKGSVRWMPVGLGSGQPEEDSLESISWLTALLDKETPAPKVRVEPEGTVTWIDWNTGKDMKSEGGHRVYKQPRNLFSAVPRPPARWSHSPINQFPVSSISNPARLFRLRMESSSSTVTANPPPFSE
ncbi:MAG: hypothetical protein ACKOF3_09710 [Spartobacteria bacterium]